MLPVAFCVRSDFDGVVSIISVAGELEIATSPQLQSELDLLFNDGAQHVLIDLTETDFVETTGLRTLLKASRQTCGTPSLSILCPNPRVRRVFELTGVAELVALHDDRASALDCHSKQLRR